MYLLLIIYMFLYLDRNIINILAEPIRRDLDLSDGQLGLLTGLAFSIFYSTLGVPIARIAERVDRGWVISGSIALWSAFTAACGLAKGFAWLLVARIGVGVGEAGCVPAANAMITDYTPPEKRASAISFCMLGVPLGLLVGMVAGGALADLYGWRTAFLIAGAPGLLIAAAALWLLKDPLRHLPREAAAAQPNLRKTLRELSGNRAYLLVVAGASVAGLMVHGHGAFLAAFLLRVHGPALAEIEGFTGPAGIVGLALGLIGGFAGGAGIWGGGWLADRFGGKNFSGYMLVCALSGGLAVPIFIGAVLMDSWLAAVALLVPVMTLASMWGGPVNAIIPSIVPPEARSTAIALSFLGLNLVGAGLGPLAIGLVSDALSTQIGSNEGLRWALIASTVFGLASVPLYLLARRELLRRADA